MANYSHASHEYEEIVREIASELGLDTFGIDFEAICVDKAKKPVQIIKANKLTEYVSNRDDLVYVVLYEDAFDYLDARDKNGQIIAQGYDEEKKKGEVRYMWIRNAMETVSFDNEKGKIIIGCPMLELPISIVEKYKDAAIDAERIAYYTIAQIDEKKKQEEAEKKEAKKANKKKNKY